MKPVSFLLLAAVLSSAGPAVAQPQARGKDVPQQPLPPPPLVPANDSSASASEPEEGTEALSPDATPEGERTSGVAKGEMGFARRVGLGLLGGMGGGLVGAGLGAGTGQLVGLSIGCAEDRCFGTRTVGAYLGALMGVPAGTYFAGSYFGGRGSYASALAGSMVGWGVVAIGQYILVPEGGLSDAELRHVLPLGILLSAPVLGSALGYQLSHEASPRLPSDGSWAALRILLEGLFGGSSGIVMAVGGIIGGAGLSDCGLFDSCGDPGDTIILFGTGLSSLLVGSALGVYGAGLLMRGHGSFWPTFLGSALGTVAGGALLTTSQSEGAVLTVLAGPLLGAIIGYEVSGLLAKPDTVLQREPSLSSAALEVLPVLTATPAGGFAAGLVGRF